MRVFKPYLLLLMVLPLRAAVAADAPPTFEEHLRPIFREKCCGCHNPDKKQGGLDLTSYGQTMAGGSSGEVIAPGDVDGSYLWQLASHASEPKMPPQSDRIPGEMLDVLRKWIAGGAIERSGGKPVARKANASLALDASAVLAPQGPAVMPPRLSLDVIGHASRPLAITGLAASPNGPLLAVGGREQILLFNTGSLDFLGVLPFPEGDVKTLRFSRNAKLLLAGGGEGAKHGRVVLWDVASATRIGELGDEFDQVLAADIAADQSVVALGGPQKVVRLLRTADGSLDAEIRKHTDWITAVEFSPDGKMLATGDRAGNAFLWETRGAREDGVLKGHAGGISAVAWRGDGAVVATASEDGKIRLWSRRDAAKLKEWEAHPGGVLGIAWLPDGRIASSGRDRKVVIWKGDGGRERELRQHDEIVLRVALTNDGGRLFSGDLFGRLAASMTSDGTAIGDLDTNPPPLKTRVETAELAQRQRIETSRAAAEKAKVASEAMQLAESQMAAARKALEESQSHLEAARAKESEATRELERWKAELEFSRPGR